MTDNSVLNLLYKGTITKQDLNWDNMNTVPILYLLTVQDIEYIRKLILSPRYSGNNKLKMDKINEVMHLRGFTQFAGGTNRIVYTHPSAPNTVFKVAIDSVGINDNPAEFKNQYFLKPYCCKVFECSPCGTIASFEMVDRITTFEEFYTIADDYWYLITKVILGKYVMEDIGTDYWMNFGIRRLDHGFSPEMCGPVILDFPYLFELDGAKLECQNQLPDGTICQGEIDYDVGFNKLVCKKCGRRYHARDLSKRSDGIGILIRQKGSKRMKLELKRGDQVIKTFDSTVERDYLSKTDPEVVAQVEIEKKKVAVQKTTITHIKNADGINIPVKVAPIAHKPIKEVVKHIDVNLDGFAEKPVTNETTDIPEVAIEKNTVEIKVERTTVPAQKIEKISHNVSAEVSKAPIQERIKTIDINIDHEVKDAIPAVKTTDSSIDVEIAKTSKKVQITQSPVVIRKEIKVISDRKKQEELKQIKYVEKPINIVFDEKKNAHIEEEPVLAASEIPEEPIATEEVKTESVEVQTQVDASIENTFVEEETKEEFEPVEEVKEEVIAKEETKEAVPAVTFGDNDALTYEEAIINGDKVAESAEEVKAVDTVEDEKVETSETDDEIVVEEVKTSEDQEAVVELSEDQIKDDTTEIAEDNKVVVDSEINNESKDEVNDSTTEDSEVNGSTADNEESEEGKSYYIKLVKTLPSLEEDSEDEVDLDTFYCVPIDPDFDLDKYIEEEYEPGIVDESLFEVYIVTTFQSEETDEDGEYITYYDYARITYNFDSGQWVFFEETEDEEESSEEAENIIQSSVEEDGNFPNEEDSTDTVVNNPLYNTGSVITSEDAIAEALAKSEKLSVSDVIEE